MELTIEIKTKPGKFQELYQTLLGLLPTIRKGKGCKECRVYRDVEDGEVFFLSGQCIVNFQRHFNQRRSEFKNLYLPSQRRVTVLLQKYLPLL